MTTCNVTGFRERLSSPKLDLLGPKGHFLPQFLALLPNSTVVLYSKSTKLDNPNLRVVFQSGFVIHPSM